MSFLSDALGINLPPLGVANPFSGLSSGGLLSPPATANGFQGLVPLLTQLLEGKLGDTNRLASAVQKAPMVGPQGPANPNPNPNSVTQPAKPVTTNPRPLPAEYAQRGITQDQWDRMNAGPAAASVPPPQPVQQPAQGGIPPAIKAGIFKGEGTHGNLDTLFGNAQAPGGAFAGTKISNMTVDQAIQFADPRGPYAQYVLHTNPAGVLATPMGAYQVVGSTLQKAKEGLGLTGNELMNAATQDAIGNWIYKHQGTGAWAGYRGPASPASLDAPYQPGEALHLGSRRTGGGQSRQAPTAGPSGAGIDIVVPGTVGVTSNGLDLTHDYNTALNNPKGGRSRQGHVGIPNGSPDQPSAGRTEHNSVNPDYKRYQALKTIKHLRGLSPVATIQAIANIGKGLRTQGGGQSA